MRTARTIEQDKQPQLAESTVKTRKPKGVTPPELKPYAWQPGQSGNPGGRPKNDFAKLLAQEIFEGAAPEEIIEGFRRSLKKGNAFAFTELANRAYGKLKETVAVEGQISLAERIQRARQRKAK